MFESHLSFVPSTTYLGIMIAYIHLSADGSGCFKARTNDSVGWVVTTHSPPRRVMCRHSAFNHRVVNISTARCSVSEFVFVCFSATWFSVGIRQ